MPPNWLLLYCCKGIGCTENNKGKLGATSRKYTYVIYIGESLFTFCLIFHGIALRILIAQNFTRDKRAQRVISAHK